MYDNLAVYVNNVCKSYGSNEILKKIYVSVERGTIYGLLGPSGCGKTTLLNCIVGRNKIDNGEIWILGERAGGSPGASVGYMPQNIALVGNFTVKEAIYFFGRIFEMNPLELYNRFNQLKRLLDLPPDGRFICNCSGGQQRRVSLAAALIHEPELLILDEPSVGADPILRDRIWNYLYKIVNEDRTTVIITTHYIEEAKQANRIGLMRGGKLLVEDAPAKLLRMFNCDTLEDIFFILSERQEKGTSSSNIISTVQGDIETMTQSTDTVNLYSSADEILKKKRYSKHHRKIVSKDRIIALLIKHIMSIIRNKSGLALLVAMPFVQMILFLAAVGREVHDLPVAVINDEAATMLFSTTCLDIALSSTVQLQNDTCHIENISCRFMTYLQHRMMRLKYYNSTSEAVEDIRRGKLIGVIHIASNISERMENRFSADSDLDQLSQGEIEVFLDMADAQVGSSLRTKLTNQYLDFQMDILDKCNMSQLARPPVAFKEFYYGHKDDPLVVFMAPGLCMITNCLDWGLLPKPTANGLLLAPLCTTLFQGDPSLVIDVLIEKDETTVPGKRSGPQIRKLKEEDRLAAVVHTITDEVGVVPRGALFRRPDGVIVHNLGFEGLTALEAREIASFLHFRAPTQKQNTNLLIREDYNYATDFLDPIDIDIPEGCWMIQLNKTEDIVVLKSLYWPGFYFYHNIKTPRHGFVYFGPGKKCLDVPFMLNPFIM